MDVWQPDEKPGNGWVITFLSLASIGVVLIAASILYAAFT